MCLTIVAHETKFKVFLKTTTFFEHPLLRIKIFTFQFYARVDPSRTLEQPEGARLAGRLESSLPSKG